MEIKAIHALVVKQGRKLVNVAPKEIVDVSAEDADRFIRMGAAARHVPEGVQKKPAAKKPAASKAAGGTAAKTAGASKSGSKKTAGGKSKTAPKKGSGGGGSSGSGAAAAE